MSIGDKKRKFTAMIAKLINYAIKMGCEISFAPEHPNHMENSLHFIGLAKDFNLYKNGVWLIETEDYEFLGIMWKEMGGSWGGDFSKPDGCHFSIKHNGRM